MNAPISLLNRPLEDRRRVPRVPFQRPARALQGGRPISVRVVDLSARGALIVLPLGVAMQPGAKFRLEIDTAGRTIAIDVCVVHLRGPRVGVRCGAMAEEDRRALAMLVERELGSAALVERPLCAMGGR